MKAKKWIALLITFCLAIQSGAALASGDILSPEEAAQTVTNTIDEAAADTAETAEPAKTSTPAETLVPAETEAPVETEEPAETAVPVEETEELSEEEYEQIATLAASEEDELPDSLDYVDPQFITDEAFFGEYDSATDTWIQPGYFDYDSYPELQNVQDMAKAGNYAAAKALITDYYRNKAAGYNISKSGSLTKANLLIADMGVENMYANELSGATIVDIANFQNTPAYVEVDVAEAVDAALTSGGRRLSLKLVGLRKDGSAVEINSKESGSYTPVLDIATRGVVISVPVSKDTYISSGSNKSRNYGNEASIRICESESSIGTTEATDENTARGWIQFDLDQFTASDTITSATLRLYGSNVGSGDSSDVVIFRTTNTSWDETGMNWNSYSHYIYSYYGEEGLNYVDMPSDSNNRYREDILRFEHGPRRLFSMYHHTDTPEYYAYYAFKQWGHFMKTTMEAGKGAGYNVGLDVSCRAAIANEIFNMMDSKYMSDDLFVTTLKYFHEMSEWMYGHWTAQEQGGNWGTSQLSGQFNLYSKFYELTNAEKWLNAPANPSAPSGTGAGPNSGINARLEAQIDDLIWEDGAYSECSISYASMTANIYLSINDIADGANLENPFSDNLLSKIRQLGRYMMFDVMPGYRDNQVGNTGNYTTDYKTVLYNLGELTGDPNLLYAGSDGKEGEQTTETSKLYDVARRAIMRTGWNDNDMYLFTDADGGIHSHGHHDDLSVSIWAKGNYLIADPLYHSYTDNDYDRELTSVKGHNTIEVDGMDQKAGGWYLTGERTGGRQGNILNWETNESYDFLTAETVNYDEENVYPQRSILFIKPGYWIVSDYLRTVDNAEHDYNQRWHMIPEADITMDDNTKTTRTNLEGSNIQVVPVGPEKYTDSQILEGYYAGANRANYVMYSQNDVAGPAVFDTVLYPEDAGADVTVTADPVTIDAENNGAVAMNILIDNRTENSVTNALYYIVHADDEHKERTVEEYEYDGTLLYAEKNGTGRRSRIFMRDATSLEENGTVIAQSEEAIEDVSVRYNGGRIYIDSSNITDEQLDGLTIRKNETVTSVLLNNESIPFSQTANYVYFGSEPIIDDTEATPTPSPTARPSGGSSGGHGGTGGGNISGGISTPITPVIPTPTPSAQPTAEPGEIALTPVQEQELEGHWAKAEIEELIKKGLVTGDETTSLGLKNEVTRAEYTVLLMRMLGETASTDSGVSFNDVNGNEWYADAVYRAAELGIVEGSDGNFRPNDKITREEMAVIAMRAVGDVSGTESVEFADESEISDWALDSVNQAAAAGIISGDENGNFRPKESALREQAFKVIYNIMKATEEE